MRRRVETFKAKVAHDPAMQEAIARIKPKRTVWGVAGIVLFFFVPELVTHMRSKRGMFDYAIIDGLHEG